MNERNSVSNYLKVAKAILGELGSPLASRILYEAAIERDLLVAGKWTYNHFLRAVRDADQFDTSKRGYVGLADDDVSGVVEEDPTNPGPILEEVPAAGAESLEMEEGEELPLTSSVS